MEKTTQDILNEAATLLEEEDRWIKGSFFFSNQNVKGCSMCAHGAIAYCGSRAIRELVDANNLQGAVVEIQSEILASVDTTSQIKNLQMAHLNANRVGLTYAYNDAGLRTKAEVVAKLREAAQL